MLFLNGLAPGLAQRERLDGLVDLFVSKGDVEAIAQVRGGGRRATCPRPASHGAFVEATVDAGVLWPSRAAAAPP